jgi:hypothetical protein
MAGLMYGPNTSKARALCATCPSGVHAKCRGEGDEIEQGFGDWAVVCVRASETANQRIVRRRRARFAAAADLEQQIAV